MGLFDRLRRKGTDKEHGVYSLVPLYADLRDKEYKRMLKEASKGKSLGPEVDRLVGKSINELLTIGCSQSPKYPALAEPAVGRIQNYKGRYYMTARFFLTIAAILVFASTAFAQFSGPGAGGSGGTSVNEVLKSARDDAWVTLRGQILKKVGHEKYLFADSTGQIVVDIDDKYFPYDRPVTPQTTIEITGEVDREFVGRTEIDVKQLTILGEGAAQKPKGGFQSK